MKKYLWIAAAALALDQLTKALALRLTAPVTLVPGLIGLRLAANTGMAFRLLSGLDCVPLAIIPEGDSLEEAFLRITAQA